MFDADSSIDVAKDPGVGQEIEVLKYHGVIALDTLSGNPSTES